MVNAYIAYHIKKKRIINVINLIYFKSLLIILKFYEIWIKLIIYLFKELNLKYNCNHGEGGKCIHCSTYDPMDAKHESFSSYLTKAHALCTHGTTSKCPNCMPPS